MPSFLLMIAPVNTGSPAIRRLDDGHWEAGAERKSLRAFEHFGEGVEVVRIGHRRCLLSMFPLCSHWIFRFGAEACILCARWSKRCDVAQIGTSNCRSKGFVGRPKRGRAGCRMQLSAEQIRAARASSRLVANRSGRSHPIGDAHREARRSRRAADRRRRSLDPGNVLRRPASSSWRQTRSPGWR